MIIPVTSSAELTLCAPVIQEAFHTVARDFNLNDRNCPSHPSFINERKLLEMFEQGISMFRYVIKNKSVGFVAIEQPNPEKPWWYIEKLSVIPIHRHKGIGKKLMEFALEEIKRKGGTNISIALIDDQTLLKEWYSTLGFKHVLSKKFDHLPFGVSFMEYNILQFSIVSGKSPDLATLIGELDHDLKARYGSHIIHDIDLQTADDTGITFVLGTFGKEKVCCGSLRPFDPHRVELKRMFVREPYRKQGFAKKLCHYLESLAKEKNYREILLETGHKQFEAISLYKKAGYKPIEKFGEYIHDPNSLCFSKLLN